MRTSIQATLRVTIISMIFIAGMFKATDSEAATYYVAKTGSDSNTCTAAQSQSTAKLTIKSGIGCLAAGDTVRVRTGTYPENIGNYYFPMPVGTASNHITMEAYPGDTVTIEAAQHTWSDHLVVFVNTPYWTLRGFILDAKDAGNTITIDGYNSPPLPQATGIRIENNEIKNAAEQGISVFASDGNEIIHNRIHGNGITYTCTPGPGCGGNGGYGMYLAGSNNLVEGNELYSNGRYAFQMYSGNGSSAVQNNIIRNNTVHGNGIVNNSGVVVAGINNLFYNNIIYNEKDNGVETDWMSGSSGNKIYNNTLYNITHYAFELNSNRVSGTEYRNNIAWQVGGQFIDYGGGTYTVTNNLFTNPSFVNATASDFHLPSTSPAIDKGTNLSSIFTTDFDGVSRPQGSAYDIGAYEYRVSSSSTLSPPQNFRCISGCAP